MWDPWPSLATFLPYQSQSPLVKLILKQDNLPKSNHLQQAEQKFQVSFPNTKIPTGEEASQQKAWDEITCKVEFANLLNSANQVHSARLLGAASPHSGAWLQALPSQALGLHLDGESTRISVTPTRLPSM